MWENRRVNWVKGRRGKSEDILCATPGLGLLACIYSYEVVDQSELNLRAITGNACVETLNLEAIGLIERIVFILYILLSLNHNSEIQ